jgi:HD-GYP domain-containing protein (c-di-GMP phosphodiesterase class II)
MTNDFVILRFSPTFMTNLKPFEIPSSPLRTRVVCAPETAERLRQLAAAAGCRVVDCQSEPAPSGAVDVDLVLCDATLWRAFRAETGAQQPRCAIVLVETQGDFASVLLRDPLVDDLVDLHTDVNQVRLRLERAVARKTQRGGGFDSVGFAPGKVDGLRPLHGSLEALISALEAKDPYTRDHSHRVCATALSLASQIAPGDPVFQERIRVASLFHDIGKIGVPEAVLNKPGALDPDEWAAVQRHVLCGVSILRPIVDDATLAMVRHHHERWDGKGYPDGVAGKDIPLGARIIAVADSWDAMTSARPYRPSMPRQKVWEILRDGAGKQWDPEIVPVFLRSVGTAQPRLAA